MIRVMIYVWWLWLMIVPSIAMSQSVRRSPSTVHRLETEVIAPDVKSRQLIVEVGDSTKLQFDPSFSISGWHDEIRMSVQLSTNQHPVFGTSRTSVDVNGRRHDRLSGISVSHDIFLDRTGLEWEISLTAPPDANVLTYAIEIHGLVFTYIAPLTPRDIAAGGVQPEAEAGMYIASHATGRHNRRLINGLDTTYQNYGDGLAFVITRPLAWDANRDTVWCDLLIQNDSLAITIPPVWLSDTAVYPVTIDPHFGHETSYGTGFSTQDWERFIYADMPAENGTLDSVVLYLKSFNDSAKIKCALFLRSDSTLVDSTEMRTFAATESDGWKQFAAVNNASLTSGTSYFMGMLGWSASATLTLGTSTGSTRTYRDRFGSDVWNDPISTPYSEVANSSYSIYAVYTITGGTVTKPRRRHIETTTNGVR